MAESLLDFVESVNGTSHLRVEQDYGDGFVRLNLSEAERRQAVQDIRSSEDIVLEMLRNSRDAHASHIFVAIGREGAKRCITVIDDGCGIPASMHDLVFESRVTSKLDTSHIDEWGIHGRGMALFSISLNAQQAYVVDSAPDLGCCMHVVSDTGALPEKSDQSTFPTFSMGEDGVVRVRGPRNILRTVCEFAIRSRAACSVYIGSTAEIAATLYAYGVSTLSAIDRLFCQDVGELPIVKRLATTGDPVSFAEMAQGMGLQLSERTARRILDGEIDAIDSVLQRVEIRPDGQGKRGSNAKRTRAARPIKLTADETEMVSYAVKEAFSEIARKYYLEEGVEPTIRTYRDKLAITVPIVSQS